MEILKYKYFKVYTVCLFTVTVTMIKIHLIVPLFYFIDNNIGFNDILTSAELEMSLVFISTIWSPYLI